MLKLNIVFLEDGQTDGRTDRQTDGDGEVICLYATDANFIRDAIDLQKKKMAKIKSSQILPDV